MTGGGTAQGYLIIHSKKVFQIRGEKHMCLKVYIVKNIRLSDFVNE